MFSSKKSDEIRLFLPYWHTNKKNAGCFFTVEGDFRYIDVELSKVASGCWIKPFKAHLKCRHVFSRFKSVFGVPTQGGSLSHPKRRRDPNTAHSRISIWSDLVPWIQTQVTNMPKVMSSKEGDDNRNPSCCFFVVCVCVALLCPASRMRLTKPSFTNWVRDLAHCRCAKLSPRFFPGTTKLQTLGKYPSSSR